MSFEYSTFRWFSNCDCTPLLIDLLSSLIQFCKELSLLSGRTSAEKEKDCLTTRYDGERIQQLRKNTGLTQADLAARIGISHTQMARYEIKNIYPPADVLKNLAEVFSTTIDFLVMGDTDSKAWASLSDAELINQFKKISALPDDEKLSCLK
ncbi:MAG: helix-turn-helix domain-containing protein [Agriterribacter sp.]